MQQNHDGHFKNACFADVLAGAGRRRKMEVDGSMKASGCGLFLRRRKRTASMSSIPPKSQDTGVDGPPLTRSDETQSSAARHAVPSGRSMGSGARTPRRTRSAETSNLPIVLAGPSVVRPRSPAPANRRQQVSPSDSASGGKLVRASSSNMMVYGDLGNLRPYSNTFKNPPSLDVLDYLPKTARELSKEAKSDEAAAAKRGMSNIMKGSAVKEVASTELGVTLSRPLPAEAEKLKEMGNKEYKNGRFAEALALYDRAIAMDRGKAAYYSNKAAALTCLGLLFEAVGECKEAIRTDPAYYRAHHRLATLYLRLGEAEKATHHFKQSRKEANPNDISRAQNLQSHISKSNEARKTKDYIAMLKESQDAASSGADSAPQVFALQAEALMKLQRHEEADSILSNAPKFGVEELIKFFGAPGNAYFLIVQAQVDMAAGRFEDAVREGQKASQLDPRNREISAVVRRLQAMATARSKGNELFRNSKFTEACIAYGEGLDHEPHNAVLLCNRAACRFKLGHYERALEDCGTAVRVSPSYYKARRRRADCNAKLERWAAAIEDYQVLLQKIPDDEQVNRALCETRAKLQEQQGQHVQVTAQS